MKLHDYIILCYNDCKLLTEYRENPKNQIMIYKVLRVKY